VLFRSAAALVPAGGKEGVRHPRIPEAELARLSFADDVEIIGETLGEILPDAGGRVNRGQIRVRKLPADSGGLRHSDGRLLEGIGTDRLSLEKCAVVTTFDIFYEPTKNC
jgi:hypothetical protein